jgi:hypothetical protein
MADEQQGQAPGSEQQDGQAQDAGSKQQEQFDAAYVQQLRDEAAKWRTQFREVQTQVKELSGKAGDSEKLSERLKALEAELAQKTAAAEAATKQAQLVRLATKAGVDPDVAALLDLSKVPVEDEKAALEVLSKLAKPGGGAQVKPGAVGATGMTDAELRERYFGGKRSSNIFGG